MYTGSVLFCLYFKNKDCLQCIQGVYFSASISKIKVFYSVYRECTFLPLFQKGRLFTVYTGSVLFCLYFKIKDCLQCVQGVYFSASILKLKIVYSVYRECTFCLYFKNKDCLQCIQGVYFSASISKMKIVYSVYSECTFLPLFQK